AGQAAAVAGSRECLRLGREPVRDDARPTRGRQRPAHLVAIELQEPETLLVRMRGRRCPRERAAQQPKNGPRRPGRRKPQPRNPPFVRPFDRFPLTFPAVRSSPHPLGLRGTFFQFAKALLDCPPWSVNPSRQTMRRATASRALSAARSQSAPARLVCPAHL